MRTCVQVIDDEQASVRLHRCIDDGEQMTNELHRAIQVELVKRGLRQADLASRIGVSPSSLSGWLVGRYEAPADLLSRIEGALGLATGVLTSPTKGGAQ